MRGCPCTWGYACRHGPHFRMGCGMQLHHVQWFAWKDHKDFARILEVAPDIYNEQVRDSKAMYCCYRRLIVTLLALAQFVKLNPHNFAITVSLTALAMHRTGQEPLKTASTFLYGLHLLSGHVSHPEADERRWLSLDPAVRIRQPSEWRSATCFCRDACKSFLGPWADKTFGSGPGALQALEEFCARFPYTCAPAIFGRRCVPIHDISQGGGGQPSLRLERDLAAPWFVINTV
jgi:hypothetical protein